MKTNIIIIAILFLGTISCKTSAPPYTVSKFKTGQSLDSAVIIGEVKNKAGEKFSGAAIKIKNQIYRAEKDGEIIFNLTPGKYQLTALWIHYKPVKTSKLKINAGDSIRINFYLEQDTTSLHE